MFQFIIRRTFWAFFLFIVATIITYIIFFVIPSDPAQIACGTHCTPEIVSHLRQELGPQTPSWAIPVAVAVGLAGAALAFLICRPRRAHSKSAMT